MQRIKWDVVTLQGVILASGLFMASAVMAAPTGEMLGNTCAGCHGTLGVSNGPAMPTIAGFPVEHTVGVMKQFKSGERPSTIMGRIAKGYTDEEITAMADFFAKQKWHNATSHANSKMASAVDPKKAEQGKKVVKQCEKCHEDNGKTSGEGVPRMAGQWLDYLLFKMRDYKDPALKVPQDKKMAIQIEKLSIEELENAAHFYAGQK